MVQKPKCRANPHKPIVGIGTGSAAAVTEIDHSTPQVCTLVGTSGEPDGAIPEVPDFEAIVGRPPISVAAPSLYGVRRGPGACRRCRFRRVWARRRACSSRCWHSWSTRSCLGGWSTSSTGARSWTRRRWPSAAGSTGSGRCPSWPAHSTVARPFRVGVSGRTWGAAGRSRG